MHLTKTPAGLMEFYYFVNRSARRAGVTKTLRVMNLLSVFLFAAVVQVSAKGIAQTITYAAKNERLTTVFAEIKKQTGYSLFYRDRDVKDISIKDIELINVELTQALETILKGKKLSFQIEDKSIFIKPATTEGLTHQLLKDDFNHRSPFLTTPPVTGFVKGPDGQPIAGANIIIKETKRGTTTNADGSFSIEANNGDVIIISSVGFADRQITVNNNSFGVVSLALSESKLDEVQIIAYGTTSHRLMTSNISSVKASDISKSPVNNVLYALQGRAPGLFIQQTSGISGNAVNVTIQGQNSIGFGNVPFYVIDGVPFNPDVIPNSVRNITTGIGSAINFINPSDIESIEILKDADATAIYGSRAANGAILITTKKGKAGLSKVDINLQNGWGNSAFKYNLLNTEQYIALRKEAYSNANATPSIVAYDINGTWNQQKYTDWQEELINNTAQYQNFQTSISGGSLNTRFVAGAGYLRETTVFPGKFSDTKASVHFNIDHNSEDRRLNFSLAGTYLQGTNKLPQTDLTSSIFSLAPNAPSLYNSDGSINWSPLSSDPSRYSFAANPIASLEQRYTGKTNNLITSAKISYEILSNLVVKIGFGYNRLEGNEVSTSPFSSVVPSARPFAQREARFANHNVESWISEPQINFNKVLFSGRLDLLIGSTFQQTSNYMQSFFAQGFANDVQLDNIQAAPTVKVDGSLQSTYKYNAIFGRLNYIYDDKYIINITTRRDGSSRFGSENLLHTFYAVSGGYIFSNEKFVKNNFPQLDFGKLRISYGTTGNDQIGDYRFLDLYTNYGLDIPYQQIVTLTSTGLPNPYLQWEETRKFNAGIDLTFFKERVLLTANYFHNRSSNQLLNDQLSTVTGFNYIIRNLPATVQNNGFEFLLKGTPINGKVVQLNTTFNITIPKNKLVRYDNLDKNSRYTVGESINLMKAYKYAGVNPETGLYQFISSTGNVTSTPNSLTDKTELIDLNPKFYGGFLNSFSCYGFSLDIFFQFVKKNGPNYRYPLLPGNSISNQFSNVVNHWKKSGDVAELQKVTRNAGEVLIPALAVRESTATFGDASYTRLKNVSISYQLKSHVLNKAHISQARIYLQGQNLITWTNYFGADPETMFQTSLPPLRMYTIGAQLTF
jgi:TonB-dependent starch-binding outer membrane protein SusC